MQILSVKILGLLPLAAARVGAHIIRPRACSFTWPAVKGDTCETMAVAWEITEAQFMSYNPGVVCESLVVGQEYCVEWSGTPPTLSSTTPTPTPTPTTTSTRTTTTATTATTSKAPANPSPTQGGITPDCTLWHLAVAGDTCWGIANSYGTFTLDQFYKWNPAVGNDCSGLWLDYYYCVGVKGTPTTTTAPTAPSPTQNGIAQGCTEYHFVVTGDTCNDISAAYGITLNQFYEWNPAVGSGCPNLWAGYYVCVGI